MPIIDNINEIQDLLKDDTHYFIKIGLTGFPAVNKYPKAKLLVNNVELWSGIVFDTVLSFEVTILENYLDIKFCYVDKLDSDTIVQDGKIVENQYIRIDYLECNGIRILGNSIREISMTNYTLTDSQKHAYISNGSQWENIKTDSLYNNGIWWVHLKKPILTSLIKQKQMIHHIFDTDHREVLLKLQQYFKE